MNDGIDKVRETLSRADDVDPGDVQQPAPPAPPNDTQDEPAPEAVAAAFPLNDIGNGQRFVTYFGEDVLWVPRVGWFTWTGQVWRKDDDGLEVRAKGQKVSARMLTEIEHLVMADWEVSLLAREDDFKATIARIEKIPVPDRSADDQHELIKARDRLQMVAGAKDRFAKRKTRHRSYAQTTGNSARIDALLKEASVTLARALDDMDADPLAVNTESGVLRFSVTDLREEGAGSVAEVSLSPHERGDLLSKMVAARYDPEATAPRFEAFLERIQPSGEMRGFLQRWFGLSMSGLPVQKLLFLYGHGANGKSVLVDLICRILDGYSATAPIEALTGQSRRGGSDATPELIPLIGARTVRSSEPEQGERFKEGMIKALTSGEPIPVRALHSDFIFVKPFFKLTISGNHKPDIRGTDDGIWRRVLLAPFDVQIPEKDRDPELGEKLWEERDGILNWMVQGLLDYLEGGLQEPQAVLEATAEYRSDSDPVGSFLTECTEVTGLEDDFLYSRDLIEAFNFWLEDKGETRWGGRTVSNALKNHSQRWRHPGSGKSYIPGKRDATGYRGIRLTREFEDRLQARQSTASSGGSSAREAF